MSIKSAQAEHVRKRIEKLNKQAEDERKRKLLHHRIDIAKAGIAYYQRGRIPDAVRSFATYLKIIEETKQVDDGGLVPTCFEFPKDLPEVMMISGIYWDLVKIYDQSKNKEKVKEFRLYLKKFVLFSMGMPYQHVSSESLRKYLATNKAVHTGELKEAYARINVTKCFIASSLVELLQPGTVPTLRNYRDQMLLKHFLGTGFVKTYYLIGPTLARLTNKLPLKLRKKIANQLDRLAERIKSV